MRRGVCICGGIGSGKSVVSRILRLRGFGVYDCDREAKRLMSETVMLLDEMSDFFGESVISEDGEIDRGVIAKHIFGDSRKRDWLNSRVHALVKEDLEKWFCSDGRNFFVESAIPVESGLIDFVECVWEVVADDGTRRERVRKRNGMRDDEITQRMNSQKDESLRLACAAIPVRIIRND